MSLTCRVRIALNSLEGGEAGAVRRALEPDNVNFPDGLSLRVDESAGGLVLEFEGTGGMGRLAGTIDEVLGHVQAALGVIR